MYQIPKGHKYDFAYGSKAITRHDTINSLGDGGLPPLTVGSRQDRLKVQVLPGTVMMYLLLTTPLLNSSHILYYMI